MVHVSMVQAFWSSHVSAVQSGIWLGSNPQLDSE
jgi:hypothetical protein